MMNIIRSVADELITRTALPFANRANWPRIEVKMCQVSNDSGSSTLDNMNKRLVTGVLNSVVMNLPEEQREHIYNTIAESLDSTEKTGNIAHRLIIGYCDFVKVAGDMMCDAATNCLEKKQAENLRFRHP